MPGAWAEWRAGEAETPEWRRRRIVWTRKGFLVVIKAFPCRVSILILVTSWVSRTNRLILKKVDTQER